MSAGVGEGVTREGGGGAREGKNDDLIVDVWEDDERV